MFLNEFRTISKTVLAKSGGGGGRPPLAPPCRRHCRYWAVLHHNAWIYYKNNGWVYSPSERVWWKQSSVRSANSEHITTQKTHKRTLSSPWNRSWLVCEYEHLPWSDEEAIKAMCFALLRLLPRRSEATRASELWWHRWTYVVHAQNHHD